MFIRQNYRIYPNKEQQTILTQWFGQARFIWNFMLSQNIEKYQSEQKFIFGYDMNNMLPELKKKDETSWLKEIPSQCLQQKCQDLDTALKASFKSKNNKKGFPKFKSKHLDQSGIRFPSFKFEGNRISLPKMKQGIKIKLHRPLLGKKGAVTIFKDKTGCYFASILVQVDEQQKTPYIENVIGIDLGLKEFAITSDGEIIKNPRFGKKQEKKLKKAQRQLSNKQKESKNKEKARKTVAKIYKNITNQRIDFINQIASSIAKANDLIAIECLNVKGMMKNHKLAKAIADVSWGQFVNALKWQAQKRGKHVVEINRYYPSSKTCSCCGAKKEDLTLADRTYHCDSCGFEMDRDLNAAINILKYGLKTFQDTVGTTEIYARGDMISDVGESAREAALL